MKRARTIAVRSQIYYLSIAIAAIVLNVFAVHSVYANTSSVADVSVSENTRVVGRDTSPQNQVIFVDVNGSDSAEGTNRTNALRTLQSAVNQAIAISNQNRAPVKIEVNPGVYIQDRVQLQVDASDTFTIEIVGAGKSFEETVFDGNGQGRTWFLISATEPTSAKFIFSNMTITNYQTAISFGGNSRGGPVTFTGSIIEHMNFDRIGQISMPSGGASTAAVRLVNSSNFIIRNNYFSDIINYSQCNIIHAIYVAHNSSKNIIESNKFSNTCGSPIRFRDRSNDNRVLNNTFESIDTDLLISSWYCDSTKNKRCTKVVECPSSGNLQTGNTAFNSIARLPSPQTLNVNIEKLDPRCSR